MKQLSGLDASFLYMETASQFGHVSSLSIYQRPDDPYYEPLSSWRHQIERRLHLLEPPRPAAAPVGELRHRGPARRPLRDPDQGAPRDDRRRRRCRAPRLDARRLDTHDALPDSPLVAMVPVSIRTGEETEKWTNRVSGIFAALPTDEPDPLQRVARVHEAMVGAKELFDGQGLNITVQSYLDTLDFGLVACRVLVPDLWDMVDAIVDDLDELASVAGVERS